MCYTRFGAYPNHTHIKLLVRKITCGEKKKKERKEREKIKEKEQQHR
jgi:hypothetical protein